MSKKIYILDKINIEKYLLDTVSPNLDYKINKIISVRAENRNSLKNFCFFVKLNTNIGIKQLFIKQAREFHRKEYERGKYIKLEPNRIFYEYQVIKLLKKIWPENCTPEIIYLDKKNHVLITSKIQSKKLLSSELKNGRLPQDQANIFGQLFGVLHSQTYGGKQLKINDKWKDHLINQINNCISWDAKNIWGKKIIDFLEKSENYPKSLIWFDSVPKNIYVAKEKPPVFLDFEMSFYFDPALDLAIFFSYLEVFKIEFPDKVDEVNLFINKFLSNYWSIWKKNISFDRSLKEDVSRRISQWQAIYLCFLAHTNQKIPSKSTRRNLNKISAAYFKANF